MREKIPHAHATFTQPATPHVHVSYFTSRQYSLLKSLSHDSQGCAWAFTCHESSIHTIPSNGPYKLPFVWAVWTPCNSIRHRLPSVAYLHL